jgi:hypothetical protein
VHGFVPIVDVANLVGSDYTALFINPYGGGDVHHVVDLSNDVLVVNQRCEFGFRGGDPRARILYATRVLGNRDDFKVLVF